MLLVRELGLELVAGTASAVAFGVAGLRHETFDHAMKDDPVAKSLPHQRLNLRDGRRREIGPHFDDDAPGRHVHVEGIFQVCRHRLASADERGDEQQEPAQRCHDINPTVDRARTLAKPAARIKLTHHPTLPGSLRNALLRSNPSDYANLPSPRRVGFAQECRFRTKTEHPAQEYQQPGGL
jgi:hypothetical protein